MSFLYVNFGLLFADLFEMYSKSQFFRGIKWVFGLGLKLQDLCWK